MQHDRKVTLQYKRNYYVVKHISKHYLNGTSLKHNYAEKITTLS